MNPNEIATFGFAALCCVAIAMWARAGLAELAKRMFKEMDDLRARVQQLSDARAESQEKHTVRLLEQERRHGCNMDQMLGMVRQWLRKPCGEELRKESGMGSDVFKPADTDESLAALEKLKVRQ
jgi:hypothetical protein